MEYFRNELLNREENYNGYFDKNPKVGFINPLKGKEISQDGKVIQKNVKKLFK
jgi:hypothetical protein